MLVYTGNYLLEKGNFDEVIKAHRQALEIKPDYPEAQHSLGVLLANEGKYSEAIEHCAEAAPLDPQFAEGDCSFAHRSDENGTIPAGRR